MTRHPFRFLAVVLQLIALAVSAQAADPLDEVDPRIASDVYAGAALPGAALPCSLIRLSPDTLKPSTAGYNPNQPIVGFSHYHLHGVGGIGYFGNVSLMAQSGPLDLADRASPKRDEIATPGYYRVVLAKHGITAELTTLAKVGVSRFTFSAAGQPADAQQRILFDASATLNTRGPDNPSSICTASQAQFTAPRTIEGSASFQSDFGKFKHTIYFAATFSRDVSTKGAWHGATVAADATQVSGTSGEDAGLYAEFAPGEAVEVRVGISLLDAAKARQNLAIAAGRTFEQIRTAAQDEWRAHLATIQTTGGTPAQRKQFYTALYQSTLMPTEVTGDVAWPTSEPHFGDLHAIWDTCRATYPLFTLIQPERQRRIVRCLLDIQQVKGWLPDYWRGEAFNIEQGGTNADIVLADAIAKHLGGFDEQRAFAAVAKDCTVPATHSKWPQTGRQELYLQQGYIPASTATDPEFHCPTSASLEYAYDDFAAATVADATGHPAEAAAWRERSRKIFALFAPDTKFFWAKTPAGAWTPGFDSELKKNGAHSPFYEGTPWTYRFSVPHDIKGLIDRFGGREQFVAALDQYFDGKHHDAGNEPAFLVPWLYAYAGRPDRSVDRVRAIMAASYHPLPGGYAGDDDSGSMAAWYVFAALGFYPVAGQDVYLMASPLFTTSTIALGGGRSFTITAVGLSDANRYIQAATLNGKPWDQAWFRHGDISAGAQLVLTMGPTPSPWGTQLPPPSLTP